jgi:hypothetical protein
MHFSYAPHVKVFRILLKYSTLFTNKAAFTNFTLRRTEYTGTDPSYVEMDIFVTLDYIYTDIQGCLINPWHYCASPFSPKCRFWKILYFVDRASRYKFLEITNLTQFFTYLFIPCLYMFQASQCSSSGDRIVLIHHLVWLVCVSDWLVCRLYRITKQSLTQTNHTRWRINIIRSPDDEHCDAWNM